MNTYTVIYFMPNSGIRTILGWEPEVCHWTTKAQTAWIAEQECLKEFPGCVVFCVNEGITAGSL